MTTDERSVDSHRRGAEGISARCAVLTVSDSRTSETDLSGDLLAARLMEGGHDVVAREWVADEPQLIEKQLTTWLADLDVDVVVTTGGTGVARRDTTIEVVERHLDRSLDGFGELFRMLSYEQVGSAAMMSRALAGLAGEVLVFAIPGSPAAVELALEKLMLPELPHLLYERSK